MRVLLVEDNKKLAQYIKQMFEESGYAIDCAYDGEVGERMAESGVYDVVILDVMLPLKDGIAVCLELREQDNTVPILMLTAKGDVDDRVLGLDS